MNSTTSTHKPSGKFAVKQAIRASKGLGTTDRWTSLPGIDSYGKILFR